MNRAYSVLSIKAVDDGQRIITGIATTPSPDRVGDIVEPLGVQFKNPMPLLWQHEHDKPVGTVNFDKPTEKGITFTAKLADVREEGKLKERIDEAWQSLKANLVRGVSIGFRPIQYSWMDDGGIRFIETEVYEMSLVTIPCNVDATINTIKSLDRKQLASLGKKAVPVVRVPPAGASATRTKSIKSPKPEEGQEMKTIAEQIAEFEATRTAKAADMEAIMSKSAETGETLDAEESEQFDTLEAEIAAIDKHIGRLRNMQKTQAANAKPVADDDRMKGVTIPVIPGRAPAVVKTVKNEEKGIGFAKFALAMYAAKGDVHGAKAFAEHAFADDTRIQGIMKAAVAAGTTTSPTWAGNLVDYQNLSGEFIEYLRPRTIVGQFGVGRVPSLRRVPFNVRIPGKTATGTAAWVGEGYAKPVTSSGYEAQTLKWAKIAAISVITDELDRFSDPAIQTLVRDDLAEAVIERMDVDFIDPAKAVGTGATESPASVTNGVTPIPSSGNDADAVRSDIARLWETADSINLPSSSAVYITDAKTARALTLLRNPLGNREFPGVTMAGGFIDEVPLIISNYVPADSNGSLFILAFASEIYLADDGMVNIDVSREASIVMDSAPNMNSGTPTAAQLVSMFQTNSLAIRAERYVRWQKRRPQAVAYLNNVNWGAAVP